MTIPNNKAEVTRVTVEVTRVTDVDVSAEAPRPRRSTAAPIALGLALIALAIVAIQRLGGDDAKKDGSGRSDTALSGEPRGNKLADWGEVEPVEFTDSRGVKFTNADLLGKVTVIDFFFTTCAGPCLELTSKMRALSLALSADPDVQLVSISVDPDADTPDVLERYARVQGSSASAWRWLTGERAQVEKLCKQFMAAFSGREADGNINHSTRIHVIDRQGHLRAIHDTQLEDEWKPAVIHSVKLLLAPPVDGVGK